MKRKNKQQNITKWNWYRDKAFSSRIKIAGNIFRQYLRHQSLITLSVLVSTIDIDDTFEVYRR